jgi:hypothetical protein
MAPLSMYIAYHRRLPSDWRLVITELNFLGNISAFHCYWADPNERWVYRLKHEKVPRLSDEFDIKLIGTCPKRDLAIMYGICRQVPLSAS